MVFPRPDQSLRHVLIGRVVTTGRISMTVAVDLFAKDLLSCERQLCVMIALDA